MNFQRRDRTCSFFQCLWNTGHCPSDIFFPHSPRKCPRECVSSDSEKQKDVYIFQKKIYIDNTLFHLQIMQFFNSRAKMSLACVVINYIVLQLGSSHCFDGFSSIWLTMLLQSSMWRKVSSYRDDKSKMSSNSVKQ